MNEFYCLRAKAGFQCPKKTAAFLGVSVRTVKNWERLGAPVHVVKLFRLLAQDLGWIGKDWEGFSIVEDRIIGPGRAFITPGMIRAFPYLESELERRRAVDLNRWTRRRQWLNWLNEGRCLALRALGHKRHWFFPLVLRFASNQRARQG
ncbi:hypothetical protein [Methylocaldum sp.]|uniref:hypothetical protein n=1 Tax=Methylocaldum sp. TaxID=1969727 RepID=UPI002D2AD31A|nr:hypothetical protein [Methylocaldum sp.]HYE37831.1 hypothetical protein [Methylocaldum sp.]